MRGATGKFSPYNSVVPRLSVRSVLHSQLDELHDIKQEKICFIQPVEHEQQ